MIAPQFQKNNYHKTISRIYLRKPSSKYLDFTPDLLNHHSLQVLVLSKRDGFERRKIIRDQTWGSQNLDNVHYFVGDKYCDLPSSMTQPWTCKPDLEKIKKLERMTGNLGYNQTLNAYIKKQTEIQQKLISEPNLIMLDMVDTYRNLTLKLKKGYEYLLHKYPEARWIAKADDDQYVRVDALEKYLNKLELDTNFNPIKELIVIGRIYDNK